MHFAPPTSSADLLCAVPNFMGIPAVTAQPASPVYAKAYILSETALGTQCKRKGGKQHDMDIPNVNITLAYQIPPAWALGPRRFALGPRRFALGPRRFALGLQWLLDTNLLVWAMRYEGLNQRVAPMQMGLHSGGK